MAPRDTVVVGAGHNGLVAACYLAMAGRDVLVLEALEGPGGGARTAETVPGYRFDLHSVAHNIINMTRIPTELGLFDAGLEYKEMNPFSVAVHADGRRVRFHRSIDATVDSIAESSPEEARAYAAFMAKAVPVVRTILPAVTGRAAGLGRCPVAAPPWSRPCARARWRRSATPSGRTTRCCGGRSPATSPGDRWPPSPPTPRWGRH